MIGGSTLRKNSLLIALFPFVSAITPTYGQTSTALTCLDIINDPNVRIGPSVAVGSYRNVLAAPDFVNLCNVDVRIDNLSFLIATPIPPSGQPLFTNLELSSLTGNLGSGSLTTTVAQGYLYGLLSGQGITIPANTTKQITLTGDVSPNAPATLIGSSVQIEITDPTGIRAVIAGGTTLVSAIANAPGTPIKILPASASGGNPTTGSSNPPQITLSAGSESSVTVNQITISNDGQFYNLFSISGITIPAGQSETFDLQKSGSQITSGFTAAVVMTVGSNPSETIQMLINVPAGN
jgi:hypothetical protein